MLATLRASSAAPEAIITASATCVTTNPLSSRPPRPVIPPIRAALKTLRKSPRYSETMGTRMTSDAAITAMAIADANTRQSGAVPAHAPSGSASVTTVKPTHARAAPKGPRDGRHDQHLDDQLLRQSLPGRTKRRTNRKLGRPRVDLPEHQGCNVGAPDQEDQCGGGKRCEQRRLHGPEQVVAHRRDPSVLRLVAPRGVVETLVEHRGQLREWRLHCPNVLIGRHATNECGVPAAGVRSQRLRRPDAD